MATDAERNRGAGAYSTPGVDQAVHKDPSGIITQYPLTKFAFQGIDPNAVTYVTSDDTLAFRGWTNLVNPSATLGYSQIRTVDGQLTKNLENIPLPVPGVATFFQRQLLEGFLVGVTVGGNIVLNRGDIFVKCVMHRGSTPGAPQNRICLFQDYVTASYLATWPGGNQFHPTIGPGKIRSITGTTPAAGADINEVVPALTRWRLIALKAALTTSATVANRFVRAVLDDGALVYFTSQANAAQTAGSIINYIFTPGMQVAAELLTNTDYLTVPSDNRLGIGHRIRTVTNGIQVGDQWSSPQYLVEEWIDGL